MSGENRKKQQKPTITLYLFVWNRDNFGRQKFHEVFASCIGHHLPEVISLLGYNRSVMTFPMCFVERVCNENAPKPFVSRVPCGHDIKLRVCECDFFLVSCMCEEIYSKLFAPNVLSIYLETYKYILMHGVCELVSVASTQSGFRYWFFGDSRHIFDVSVCLIVFFIGIASEICRGIYDFISVNLNILLWRHIR